MAMRSSGIDQKLNAIRWLRHASDALGQGHVFNGYFSAYIALVAVSATSQLRYGGVAISDDDDAAERKAIETAMRIKSKEIAAFLDGDGVQKRKALWQRSVDGDSDVRIIAASKGSTLESSRDRLIKFWSPLRTGQLSDQEMEQQAYCLAQLFRNVRNRLFHGHKVYEASGPDADLLACVTPVLIGVVEAMEPLPSKRSPERRP